ncbi:MAG: DNA repair protein RecN [Clostridia bacterium]|nr:DNA repair protein RecN [Clostridia bacterium]
MLENLIVKNIALIENVEIDFEKGLNVLTGETGAGKSILLDAVGLLLGDRIDKNLLRNGADICKVIGKFSIENGITNQFEKYCEKYDFEYQDEILISRSYTKEGKSDIRINGEPSTLAMLKELGNILVNSYGQNDNQEIFDENNHLQILDNFAGTLKTDEYSEYVNQYKKLKEIEKKLDSFGGSQEERLRNLDILSFQIQEIEDAKISSEDFEEIENKRKLLLNIGKIISNTTLAQNYIDQDVLANISKSKQAIEQASGYDESLSSLCERMKSVQIELDDIFETLRDYNNGTDFSEQEQQQIEDRFSLYNKLMRKYGKNVEEILERYSELKNEYDMLLNADKEIEVLNKEKSELTKALLSLGGKIREYRQKNAKTLCDLIVQNLQMLNMKNSAIEFVFDDSETIYSNGLDRVKLMFSANLGEEKKQLNKIASGGEISRFMLSLKSVIAKVDNLPTMIFDEIDTGISGTTSEAVAKQMAIIGKNHQVIAVTHSQQIASMADANFFIQKLEELGRTKTVVKRLNEEEKIYEVARFLSGDAINEQALNNAKELVFEQEKFKKSLEKIDN